MTDVASQLQLLVERHPMGTKCHRRTKLQPLHLHRFSDDNDLFCEFARVVCETRSIPRKELFETWAMALYVQDHFPNCQRFADLASGHGLLSWALMALANNKRSAVCIDIQMPLATEILQKAMEDHWPGWKGQWDYVQGKLECLEPDSTTLLLGVHCCGPLSDRIIDLAIQGNCPLALVPCCHSRKCLCKDQWGDFDSTVCNITDFIDSRRVKRLEAAGFTVCEQTIPELFTPKNRILLATPPPQPILNLSIPKWKLDEPSTLCIPVANNSEAKTIVRSLSGRAAALEREKLPPMELIVPLDYGSDSKTAVTTQQMQSFVDSYQLQTPYQNQPSVVVEAIHSEPIIFHKRGIRIQNFNFRYDSDWENPYQFHIEACQGIPNHFEGVTVQALPKKLIRKAALGKKRVIE